MICLDNALTPNEVAALLRCNRQKVIKMIQSGMLPGVNTNPPPRGFKPRYIILREDLERFITESKTTPPVQEPVQRRRRKKVATKKYF